MKTSCRFSLRENIQGGGKVARRGDAGWHLEIPPGGAGRYRLAQLDDYAATARSDFPWSAAMRISLRARASSRAVPGTWGFGLWNDPFGLAVIQGSRMRLPALPNAAWFFFASPANYLSIRDDLPAHGQLAATFAAPRKLPIQLLLGLPLFSLAFVPWAARRLRRWLRDYVRQDSRAIDLDPTQWHAYELERRPDRVIFKVDGQVIQETETAPQGSLGAVIWIDNQYASWRPDGRIAYGTLENDEAAWLQIDSLEVALA